MNLQPSKVQMSLHCCRVYCAPCLTEELKHSVGAGVVAGRSLYPLQASEKRVRRPSMSSALDVSRNWPSYETVKTFGSLYDRNQNRMHDASESAVIPV